MQEENLEIKRTEESVDSVDYIDAIKGLKEELAEQAKRNDTLRLQNKKLLDTVVNGQPAEQEAPKPKVDIQELRNKLFNNENQTNLEYITNVLNLRNALIENGEDDPFVPHGNKIVATDEDYLAADRVAKGLQEMVDVAEGSPEVFQNEYQRRVIDSMPTRRK